MQGKMLVHNIKYTISCLYLHILKKTFKPITSVRSKSEVKGLDVHLILPVLETCIQRASHPTKAQIILAY